MTENVDLQRTDIRNEWVRNETLAVGTTSVEVAPQRRRISILVRNTSPNAIDIITVHMGNGLAVANKGIVLQQNESFSDSTDTGYEAFQGTITAICATVNGQLSIMER